MVRYGVVDLYCVKIGFIINLLSLIFSVTVEPINYSQAFMNAVLCIGCLFAKPIATQFYGTSNIRFLY